MEEKVSSKDWLTSLMLCWFLGFLGVHRLYSGKLASGFLMLDATILSAILCLSNLFLGLTSFIIVGGFVANDFLNILFKNFKDCRGAYISADNIE